MHIVLFDIDGTLLHTGGAGQGAIERALDVAFGVSAPTDGIPTAGRTDRGIARDLLRYHGIDETEAAYTQLLEAYLQVLPSELTARPGKVYPGVRDLLRRLSARADVRLGLLTGNYEQAAWLKLRHYDLLAPFAFGGFGDRHPHRDDVAREALAAASRHHAPDMIDPNRLWVLGDTPADVRCARAINARAVAVATGASPREELAATNPDHLFADFGDVDSVLALWN